MNIVRSLIAVVLSLTGGIAVAGDFAVLGGGAVTCTTSSVTGNVGLANVGTITKTGCTIAGATEEGTAVAQAAYAAFLGSYATLKTAPSCDFNNVPLAGAFLPPGVYCYDAAVTVTNSTLTLVGSATDTWIFRVGTLGTGALTGTNFTVVMTGGATCNNHVSWWTAQGATLTDSVFVGNVLAGASVTVTRGRLTGQVEAGGAGTTAARTGAVTLTNTAVDFCPTLTPPPQPPLLPVFVIGDLQQHAVGDVVNFWGSHWWTRNAMSGLTSPGTASFKGFATRAQLLCGGAWESLPGNSPPPPATIADDIAVIVTSTVIKTGQKLSGDVQQIVVVHQDGGYAPNPGHEGNGAVTSIVCTRPLP